MTRHLLPGLRPTPLAAYLAGLGLVRLLGEQADPDLICEWTPAGLVIESTVDDIAAWLAESYVPTPVLSPWNEGSGFGEKDKTPKQTLDDLVALTDPRLDGFREAVAVATEVGRRYRAQGWSKEQAVRWFRNWSPERLLPWIDAAVVLAADTVYFPPLLGTGGNDGRLDFSTTFHQRLVELLSPAPRARSRSLAFARDLIEGVQQERLVNVPVGQFDPGAAGGRNSSPFGAAEPLLNPWAYLLLVEGALLFAASAVRRQQHGARRAAIPFTVTGSPDGSASGADEPSRGEVWVPVWAQPFTLPEVRQLFTEARASWNGRPAQKTVEFYAATRTLGVARGVDAFVRYGLHQRNGLAFVAVPIERVEVGGRPDVRLAARLEEWVSWARRGDSSTAIRQALRCFDAAHFKFARDGDPRALAALLAAVTDLEQTVGRSGRARDNIAVRIPPSAEDFLPVLQKAECAEARVAVGLASCATRPGTDPSRVPARTMRQLLLPIDPDRRWRDAPLVPGFGSRPLLDVLADVLEWRSRTALDEPDTTRFRGIPTFRSGIPVPEGDLHDLAAGRLNLAELTMWLRACLALRWDRLSHSWQRGTIAMPVPVLGLLHPLADGLPVAEGAEPTTPRLALGPGWAVRLATGRVREVHEDAVRRLRQAGWMAVPPPGISTVDGVAVAAALVPRCARPQRALRQFFGSRIRTDDEDTPRLIEEMA